MADPDPLNKPPKSAPTIRPFERFKGQVEKTWLPEQLMWRSEISSNAKLVWMRLARYEGKKGVAAPKLETLSRQLGLTKSATQRAMAELVEFQLISTKIRRGQHRPNFTEFLDHPWFNEGLPIDEFEGMSDNVPSNPPAGHAQPTSGLREASEDDPRNPPVGYAQPTSGLLRAPATHQWFSGEGSQLVEGSLMEGSLLSPHFVRSHASTHEKPDEPFGLAEGQPPPLIDDQAGDQSEEELKDPSSGPYHLVKKLSVEGEKDMGTFETLQKLGVSIEETKARHKATQRANEERRSKNRRAKQSATNLNGSPAAHVRVKPFEDLWRAELAKKFPDLDMASVGRWFLPYEKTNDNGEKGTAYRPLKEAGQVSTLVKKFDEKRIATYLRWAIANWDKLRTRFGKSPKLPTIGWLLTLSDALVPEATMTVVAKDVQAEADAWLAAHPDATRLPPDLLARLQAARSMSK